MPVGVWSIFCLAHHRPSVTFDLIDLARANAIAGGDVKDQLRSLVHLGASSREVSCHSQRLIML